MRRMELLLHGLTAHDYEALHKAGIPVNTDYWGCQEAVCKLGRPPALVIAVEFPDDMDLDRVINRIRTTLDESARRASRGCIAITVHNRTGWQLTGADLRPELVCVVTTDGCTPGTRKQVAAT